VPRIANRIASILRREGASGAAAKASKRVGRQLFLREDHIWYAMVLAGDRPRRELPDGFEVRRGGVGDIDALEAIMNQPSAELARDNLGPGELYLVTRGDDVVFACWIYPDRAPVAAARGGWMQLPATVACLEDSGINPDFRGMGIAPAAWTAIADRLLERGIETLVTKVAVDNEASRRAVIKSGFAEVAEMRMRRIALLSRVQVLPMQAPGGDFLRDALAR
jgi:ribosomal protein S18 acetylase RimI-like enzyme